jgi:hypothetical protein
LRSGLSAKADFGRLKVQLRWKRTVSIVPAYGGLKELWNNEKLGLCLHNARSSVFFR